MRNPLTGVDDWIYHLGDVTPRRAREIAAEDPDLVVTEWASYAREEAPYGPRILNALRDGDPDRLVVSYLSIGEAEPYRFYWDRAWERDAPEWLDEVNPEWTDNIRVRYWMEAWQEIVLDYAGRIFEQGFDGLYLDIVSAYERYEDVAPGRRDHRADMVAFIADLRAVADAAEAEDGRPRVIIAQNAEELVREPGYTDLIDGIAREDLRFYYEYGDPDGFETLPDGEFRYALNLLKRAERAGVETFAVEYVPSASADDAAEALAAEAAALSRAGIPLYVAGNRDLDEVFAQSDAPGGGGGAGEGGRLVGGPDGDVMRGTGAEDRMLGRGGDDLILGRGGADRLGGGAGADVLEGGGGADRIAGGGGDDELFGGRSTDRLRGGAGDDWLDGGAGRDVLVGGAGADAFVLHRGPTDEARGFDPDADAIALTSRGGGPAWTAEDTGRGALVTGARGETLLLRGVEADALSADSFFFDL